jgi:1,4-alpha-glucan branching enzyme
MVTQLPNGTVQFEFFRPEAREVFLAGEFNGWRTHCLMMQQGEDGWWRYHMLLSPGFYQFRYCADGQWHTDYAAFGIEPTPYGFNSVLKVDSPAMIEPEVEPAADSDSALQAA